jgi:tRNA-dihydrouridine synthase
VSLPVTAKTRLGWDSLAYADEVASTLAEAGLDMLVVHGRTVDQGYSGKADWGAIERAARAVTIPVVGNGDISTAAGAIARLESGSVAGVMVGRGILGNPVFFENVKELISGAEVAPYTPELKMTLAAEHFTRSVERYGEKRGVLDMRKQLSFYFRGIEGAARLRERLMGEKSPERILELLTEAWKTAN